MRPGNKALTLLRNSIFTCLAVCLLVVEGPPAHGLGQKPAISERLITNEMHGRLVQLMLAAADYANQTGDDTVFRQLSATAFSISNIDAEVEAGFDILRRHGSNPGPFIRHSIQWKSAPTIENGTLRLVGTLPTKPVQTDFDMSWQIQDQHCRLAAISITLSPV